MQTDTDTIDLNKIAARIRADWFNVNYAARPYLDAMFSLHSLNDTYGVDSGSTIVSYFLANAGSWRGEIARQVKKELREMLK